MPIIWTLPNFPELGQRTAGGMEAKMRAGGWPHKAPEGYINEERLVSSNKYERWVEIDPENATVLREAWGLLLTDNYTLKQICEKLTDRGYTRANGSPWTWDDRHTGKRKFADNIIHRIFHNPFYAGWVVSERFSIKKGEIRGRWEPIITNEKFEVGKKILHKPDSYKSRVRKHFYLLRNLLWVEVDWKLYKMFVSTPTGKTKQKYIHIM